MTTFTDVGSRTPLAGNYTTPFQSERVSNLRTLWKDMSSRHISGGSEGALVAKQRIARQLKEIGEFKQGWDGEGAEPFTQNTLVHALSALSEIVDATAAPDIVPNVNGTISMEWETPKGYAHLEIGTRCFSFLLKPTWSNPIGMKAALPLSYKHIAYLVSDQLYNVPQDNAVNRIARFAF